MYYLTIWENDLEIVSRLPFEDFGSAIATTSRYYRPRTRRSVLEFTTEVINGALARAYAQLLRPERINEDDPNFECRYHKAVKNENAFDFDANYLFVIESDIGIADSAMWAALDAADDE